MPSDNNSSHGLSLRLSEVNTNDFMFLSIKIYLNSSSPYKSIEAMIKNKLNNLYNWCSVSNEKVLLRTNELDLI